MRKVARAATEPRKFQPKITWRFRDLVSSLIIRITGVTGSVSGVINLLTKFPGPSKLRQQQTRNWNSFGVEVHDILCKWQGKP